MPNNFRVDICVHSFFPQPCTPFLFQPKPQLPFSFLTNFAIDILSILHLPFKMGPPLHRLHVGPREFGEKVQAILTEIQVRATATDFPLQKSLPIRAPDHLPLEIVHSILAEVEYPSYVFKRRSEKKTYHARQRWAGRKASSPPVMALYLTTDPLPRNLASHRGSQSRCAAPNETGRLGCPATRSKTRSITGLRCPFCVAHPAHPK